jgi:hypothetical protein
VEKHLFLGITISFFSNAIFDYWKIRNEIPSFVHSSNSYTSKNVSLYLANKCIYISCHFGFDKSCFGNIQSKVHPWQLEFSKGSMSGLYSYDLRI